MAKQPTKTAMSDDQFTNEWNLSDTLDEFCRKTDYKPTGAYSRAARIREQTGWALKHLGSPPREETARRVKKDLQSVAEAAPNVPEWVIYAAGVFDVCGTADINGDSKMTVTLRIVTRNRMAAEYIATQSGGQVTQHDNYVSVSWPDPIAQHDFLSQICRHVKTDDGKLRAIAQWVESVANVQIALQHLERFKKAKDQ